jgi:dUTP pyrophosphatase
VGHFAAMKLSIQRRGTVSVPLPTYQTEGAAGMDLHAALVDGVVLRPGERRAIPTGLAMAVPRGFEAQVRPRSGLARDHGVTVLNAPGTIDADYRGEVSVVLVNHGAHDFLVDPLSRIAQLVVAPVVQATLVVVDSLDATDRGEGGYGSTGAK